MSCFGLLKKSDKIRKCQNIIQHFQNKMFLCTQRVMSHLQHHTTSSNNGAYLPYYIYMVVYCVLTQYFFPFQSFQWVACPRKKSHGNVPAPCPSCPLFVLQYLCFIILCLFLESWRFWSSSDNFHFWTASTQAQSVFTKRVICTELRNKSHTSFLCVRSWVDLSPIWP